MGGIFDRTEQRSILFDIDGTAETARVRALCEHDARPTPRRRIGDGYDSGYAGRKRGEVVHSRLVTQQAHTREFLSTRGEAGNGSKLTRLRHACADIVAYLRAHGLAACRGVLRMDGEFGRVGHIRCIAEHGLGYLTRAVTYALLKTEAVRTALSRPSHQHFVQTETGWMREVFDVGFVEWRTRVRSGKTLSIKTRLIVTRRRLSKGEVVRIGKRMGEFVFELFVTDRAAEGWTALDVLTLFFGRGGFEATLAHEERESAAGLRVTSGVWGQEVFEIVCQWVWNIRIALGFAHRGALQRITRLAPAVDVDAHALVRSSCAWTPSTHSICSPATMLPRTVGASSLQRCAKSVSSSGTSRLRLPIVHATTIAPGHSSAHHEGRFTAKDFRPQSDGTALCPANNVLRVVWTFPPSARGVRVTLRARASDCRSCELQNRRRCLRPGHQDAQGRSINLLRVDIRVPLPARSSECPNSSHQPLSAPGLVGCAPFVEHDIAASTARFELRRTFRQQRVEIEPAIFESEPTAVSIGSLDQRAHRRLTWWQLEARNARAFEACPRLRLYGMSAALSKLLQIPMT